MIYHVIIALNSEGNRKVGNVISFLEKKGLEFGEIRKKTTSPNVRGFPDVRQSVIQYQLNEMDAMVFYRRKFTPEILNEKIKHFFGNHVELFFEDNGKSFDSNELWESIVEKVFHKGKKLPLMFVVTSGGENGFDGSFIPDSFEPDGSCHFDPRTLVPLEGA